MMQQPLFPRLLTARERERMTPTEARRRVMMKHELKKRGISYERDETTEELEKKVMM